MASTFNRVSTPMSIHTNIFMSSPALACIAANGALLLGLGVWTSMTRNINNNPGVITPDPKSHLYKLQRAHANTAEYVPMMSLLMYAAEKRWIGTLPSWLTWSMIGLTVSRYLLAAGIILSPDLSQDVHPLRMAGAWGTYGLGLVMCYATISQ